MGTFKWPLIISSIDGQHPIDIASSRCGKLSVLLAEMHRTVEGG